MKVKDVIGEIEAILERDNFRVTNAILLSERSIEEKIKQVEEKILNLELLDRYITALRKKGINITVIIDTYFTESYLEYKNRELAVKILFYPFNDEKLETIEELISMLRKFLEEIIKYKILLNEEIV